MAAIPTAGLDAAAAVWSLASQEENALSPPPELPPIVVDSVTKLGSEAAGRVVVGASHGGIFAAWIAAAAHVRAVILNDAGIGRDGAGVAGLAYLDRLGIAAAAVDHDSARIGDGADHMARGILSRVNATAAALGIAAGQPAAEAARLLAIRASPSDRPVPPEDEARHRIAGDWGDAPAAWALDSNSLVRPDDAGAIIVTGSHGGLLGGKPETAIRVDAYAAVYNDAGGGIDEAGFSRLPALDGRAIAAATVDAFTARIGDGRSTYQDGIVTRVNATARRRGAAVGMSCIEFVARMARAKQGDKA